MAHYDATIPSSWTPEQTFDYLADFRSVVEWDPSIPEATLVSGTPRQVGAVYELVLEVLGRRTPLRYEAIEVEQPTRLVYRAEIDSILATDTITIGHDGTTTTVTYDAQLELKGVRKLADPLMQVGLRRESEKARKGLEAKLAGSPRSERWSMIVTPGFARSSEPDTLTSGDVDPVGAGSLPAGSSVLHPCFVSQAHSSVPSGARSSCTAVPRVSTNIRTPAASKTS